MPVAQRRPPGRVRSPAPDPRAHQGVPRLPRRRRRRPQRRRGHRARARRAQRRRQDHPVQPAHRVPRADRRARSCSAAEDITGRQPEQIAHLGVARSFQITSLFDAADRAVDHVELALPRRTGLGYRFWRSSDQMRQFRDRADGPARPGRPGRPRRTQRPASLAYGQKRALELALALALDPAAAAARRADGRDGRSRTSTAPSPWSSRSREGRTVVLVEHNMNVVGVARRHGHRAAVRPGARRGHATTEVRNDERVITAYLGDGPMLSGLTGCPPGTARRRCCATSTCEVAPGRGRHARRPQRRRQDHAAALRDGPAPARSRARVDLGGQDLGRPAAAQAGRRGLGWVPDDRGIYATLSVEENLTAAAGHQRGRRRGRLEQVYEHVPGAARAPRLPRHQALRRRAADARHRPGAADGRAAAAAATSRPRAWPR